MLIGGKKLHEEIRKYPILYNKSCKGYMVKNANCCFSAKRYHETKLSILFYVVLFQFFVVFFENKSTQ